MVVITVNNKCSVKKCKEPIYTKGLLQLCKKHLISGIEKNHRKCCKIIRHYLGDNKYIISTVPHSKVEAGTKLKIKTQKSGWFDIEVRKATYTIAVSRQHDLPMVIDGLVNLYSKKIMEKDVSDIYDRLRSITVYKSVWIHQARGTKMYPESGHIAHARWGGVDFYYHLPGCINTKLPTKVIWRMCDNLNRKIRSEAEFRNDRRLAREDNKKFFERIPDKLEIRYRDAKRAGMCTPGINNFVNVFNLNIKKSYKARFVYKIVSRNNKYKYYLSDLKKVIRSAMRK